MQRAAVAVSASITRSKSKFRSATASTEPNRPRFISQKVYSEIEPPGIWFVRKTEKRHCGNFLLNKRRRVRNSDTSRRDRRRVRSVTELEWRGTAPNLRSRWRRVSLHFGHCSTGAAKVM